MCTADYKAVRIPLLSAMAAVDALVYLDLNYVPPELV